MTSRAVEQLVSAVVVTIGRKTLLRAVCSAIGQTHKSLEVVVVFNGSEAEADESRQLLSEMPSVRFIVTGVRVNGNAARNVGVLHARGSYVALLDDDDFWHPEKVELQVRRLVDRSGPWVSVTGLSRTRGREIVVWPGRAIRDTETVADYLFVRERWIGRPNVLQTSSYLAPTSLFRAIQFDESLKLHQDIDWLMRAQASGARITMDLRPLTEYSWPDQRSTSKSSSAAESLAWALDRRALFSQRGLGDFILFLPHSFATRVGDWRTAWAMFPAALRHGRPSPRSVIIAVGRMLLASTWRGRDPATRRKCTRRRSSDGESS
jgi:glycosyltransferase involved in cell wall biosynthesis